MKFTYVRKDFRAATMAIIRQADAICDEYMEQRLRLTIRQLYYQFVARDLLPNSQKSYRKIKDVMKDARLAGLIDWDAIEDRSRSCFDPQAHVCETPEALLDGIEHSLVVDLWKRQPVYCEVWVEKDALSNVLEGACDRFQVPFLACKGNLSTSEARSAAVDRFIARVGGIYCSDPTHAHQDKPAIIFHLADHDPNGIDMTRDLQARFDLFTGGMVEVRRIALTMDQVEELRPPPNPAKESDSRFAEYAHRFGPLSWELDALNPAFLRNLVHGHIRREIDADMWNEEVVRQAEIRNELADLAPRWAEVRAFLAGHSR